MRRSLALMISVVILCTGIHGVDHIVLLLVSMQAIRTGLNPLRMVQVPKTEI